MILVSNTLDTTASARSFSAVAAGTALALAVVTVVAASAPAFAQEGTLAYQDERSVPEERTSSRGTTAPQLVQPGADLQRALQRLVTYPELAWEMKVDGTGSVAIRIDTTGRVTEATVIKGWGFGLDREVLSAVRELRFRPARSGGAPVETVLQVPVTLTLD